MLELILASYRKRVIRRQFVGQYPAARAFDPAGPFRLRNPEAQPGSFFVRHLQLCLLVDDRDFPDIVLSGVIGGCVGSIA